MILEKENLEAAIGQYQEVIRRAPQSYLAYFHLGLIYAQKLLSTQAEWYFKKTIQIKPDFTPAYYNLCIFYLSLPKPDYEQASQYFNQAKNLGYKVDPEIEKIIQERKIPDK